MTDNDNTKWTIDAGSIVLIGAVGILVFLLGGVVGVSLGETRGQRDVMKDPAEYGLRRAGGDDG